jgi:hypothetical protein
MKKSKRALMYEQTTKHGINLLGLFPDAAETDPVLLCKKLRILEGKAERAAVGYCNGAATMEQWEQFTEKMLDKVDNLLQFRKAGIPVFVNGDPRGYALKIKSEWMYENGAQLHRDWGGYGIIAPDLIEA